MGWGWENGVGVGWEAMGMEWESMGMGLGRENGVGMGQKRERMAGTGCEFVVVGIGILWGPYGAWGDFVVVVTLWGTLWGWG